MGEHLQAAIDHGRAKPYYGQYIIYPRKFPCELVYMALLVELEQDYEFVQVFPGTVKAIPKNW